MGFVVPNTIEVEVINQVLTPALTLRLYGNNVTPNATSVTANFTEISGGGYANKPLTFVNWNITPGAPSEAVYGALQNWLFTGPIDAPATIYGYYVTRNSDGKLMWAERFPAANVPFTPIAGSKIALLPKFDAESFN